MKVTSSAIVNGVFEDKYGKRGELNALGMPTYSIPVKIEDAPAGTKSYALVLDDKDAFPVSGGFVWVHWVAANIQRDELQENESQTAKDFVQGVNSWLSIQGGSHPAESCSYYGGMAPPDAPHIYELRVYALDTVLDLKPGFYMNEMFRQMEGHVLEEVVIKGEYKN
ncbi:MAG TPA: YbhB/YbcL family Raf kinase inhibitor-like protein [Firmicutes bacterium]|nr:YbhB/YbcL family Raf kinase inhibitor-like protein [Bacillales bacterium]HJA40316.1 YbhB/YbcL family Raf kinase inhibitor-like protein [Bacillota bacterium]